MGNLIDGWELLHQYLSTIAGLTAQIGTNLFGPGGLPANWTPKKTVVFLPGGGPGNASLPLADERVMFYCYGATATDAMTVARALVDGLDRAGRADVTITGGTGMLCCAHLQSRPAWLPEPETNWPRVVCVFRVQWCERLKV